MIVVRYAVGHIKSSDMSFSSLLLTTVPLTGILLTGVPFAEP
ncbi:hypothetical protein ES703_47453 [subsurface metagenome]